MQVQSLSLMYLLCIVILVAIYNHSHVNSFKFGRFLPKYSIVSKNDIHSSNSISFISHTKHPHVLSLLPNHHRLISSTSAVLYAQLAVGDNLIAEVDDVTGTPGDPIAQFKIRNGKDLIDAEMSMKMLSTTERLALQIGSMVQVYVSNPLTTPIQVNLKKTTTGAPSSPSPSAGRMQDGRFQYKPVKTNSPFKASIPASGLLLNQLKTGMKLDGVVTSCTNYACFVNVNVYRSSKGGSFSEVNGMLHRADSPTKLFDRCTKGSQTTVYVREVYKNSGRFTLTLDPTINKEKILQLKESVKVEGKERRRSRRMRRQLDSVGVGDTVTGYVQKVTPDGVVVLVNSLGALNVTGLLNVKDLPKQFSFPPDLKPSFQQQVIFTHNRYVYVIIVTNTYIYTYYTYTRIYYYNSC